MSEFHPDGYLKHSRDDIGKRHPDERKEDYDEIWSPDWDEQKLKDQGERCMDCGVATCMSGCPIGNVIPDWNDLVHRGDWKRALKRLHATNNFPEFTGYTCPAPCEDACVLNYNDDPVTIKSIERAIVDKGWEEGWIKPMPPDERTGKSVAVVGSGPAGLAAAQQLNRAGHYVTVYERDDRIGGLMVYGIPDFKYAKKGVERRVNQMREEGVSFETGVEVGVDCSVDQLNDDHDAVLLAIGAQQHRDLGIDGRELDGIHFAMPYLIQENRRQAGKELTRERIFAQDKNVIVLGGGDTGADCVATAHRQGAEQVIQISINQKPPEEKELPKEEHPWPEMPQVYRKTYAQKEGGEEKFSMHTKSFLDKNGDGHVDHLGAEKVKWEYDDNGRRVEKEEILDENVEIPADLVLIAIGFTGPESDPFDDSELELEDNGTFAVDEHMMTTKDGVFAAGDANRGQSLVVWAIGEGRDAARNIDRHLMGETNLPASLRTMNPPLNASQ
jgi:glutamate synthase (NADPH/NADH) small chain